MHEMIGPRTLWAMETSALAQLLAQHSLEGLVPAGLRGLAALATGSAAAAPKQPDPIKEGSTFIMAINGPLSPMGSWSGTSTNWIARTVREAAADPKIGAIIMKIYSPGGLVIGTAEAGDAIFEARQSKPVIAVADSYAFSAAHWLATQASAFYATTSGEVGSVGVRGGHVDMSGFEDKIGMKTTLIASSPEKIAGHPYAPLSDEDRADMQAEIDEMNTAFLAAIARGRGMKPGDVAAMHGQGRTFSASRAAAAGVIDGVMTMRDVVAKYSQSNARLKLMRARAELLHSSIDI